MRFTQNTISHNLTLDEVLSRLSASDAIDGLALFGSRTANRKNPTSDYDLLLLITHLPVSIFQMLTHIDGIMADVVFVETEAADRALTTDRPVSATSTEGMFLLKMQKAQIVYDASGQLQQAQHKARHNIQSPDWLLPSTAPTLYAAWFWQNHGLYHLKRMVQSEDPVYLTAVDMMMLSGLSEVCRAYYTVRHLPWQGEKEAIRYLQDHDPGYLALFRECIAAVDRARRLNLYEQLVVHTLAPVGKPWTPGITAVYLRDTDQHPTHVDTALAFWESLLTSTSSSSLSVEDDIGDAA